jgi:hypothetical protein
MIGIYKITSPSKKIYIGQSWNIEQRFKFYREKRCKNQRHLYYSLNKYGVEFHTFEILLDFDYDVNQEYLDHCEQFFMDYYKDEEFELLNIKEAGSKGKHSKETCKKISEGNKISQLGTKKSKETCKKISESNKGRKSPTKGIAMGEEQKNKIRESLKGNIPWNKGRRDLPKHSEEHRKKINESKKKNKSND